MLLPSSKGGISSSSETGKNFLCPKTVRFPFVSTDATGQIWDHRPVVVNLSTDLANVPVIKERFGIHVHTRHVLRSVPPTSSYHTPFLSKNTPGYTTAWVINVTKTHTTSMTYHRSLWTAEDEKRYVWLPGAGKRGPLLSFVSRSFKIRARWLR